MSERPRAWIVGVVGVCAVTTLSGMRIARGQDPVPRQEPRAEAGRDARPDAPDVRMLVAHGLAMAIDGSMLEGMAAQAAGGTVAGGIGSDVVLPPGPPGARPLAGEITGTSRVVTGRDTLSAGTTRIGGTGTGTELIGDKSAAAPVIGGTGTGTPVVGGTAAEHGNTGTDVAVAGTGAVAAAAGRATAAATPLGQALRQDARRAFDASDRLFRAAAVDGASSRFYRAANRYVTTLRLLGGPASNPDGNGADSSPLSAADLAALTVVNHGVKEALDAFQLRQMVRDQGSSGSEASRALLDHARRMEAESQMAIDDFASRGTGGPAASRGAVANAPVAGTAAEVVAAPTPAAATPAPVVGTAAAAAGTPAAAVVAPRQ